MRKSVLLGLFLVVGVALLSVEPAFAGPGGMIAHTAFETFWGRVLFGLIVVILFPVILYVLFMEKRAERRTRKDLRFLANYTHNPLFDWLVIQQRAKDCFFRVHASWENEDLSQVSEWMTDWYWQNQQMAHLDRWKREGLVNRCTVKKITNIRPLLFVHRNYDANHEDSMLVLSISARMRDYLQERNSGKVVEGSKRIKEVETIWTFTLEDKHWKVSAIEEGRMSLSYAKLVKELPAIHTTVADVLRA